MPTGIPSIQGMLSQMQGMTEMASAGSPRMSQPSTSSVGGFAGELAAAMKSVSNAQMNAAQKQRHFELGVPGVQLNDVMIDMQKASIGFQTAVQVRNKLMTAYQTIASMPL